MIRDKTGNLLYKQLQREFFSIDSELFIQALCLSLQQVDIQSVEGFLYPIFRFLHLKRFSKLTNVAKNVVKIGMRVEKVTRKMRNDSDERSVIVYGYKLRPAGL